MVKPLNLTHNQKLVLNALKKAKKPLSAYTILDQLRDKGFKAPLQVYRALDKLIEFGVIHRLESLNAFISCTHDHPQSAAMIAFTICKSCGTVSEFSDQAITKRINLAVANQNFHIENTTIEIEGACNNCLDR